MSWLARLHTGLDIISGCEDPSDLLDIGYQFGLVGRDVMAFTASNLAPIAKAVIQVPEAGGRTRWRVRTNRYGIDRKHTGQNKDGIHRENVYMCIGEEVEDGAHCLGVVCGMKRIQKERMNTCLVSGNCQDHAWRISTRPTYSNTG